MLGAPSGQDLSRLLFALNPKERCCHWVGSRFNFRVEKILKLLIGSQYLDRLPAWLKSSVRLENNNI